MLAPKAGRRLELVQGLPWAADNGCFTTAWDADAWHRWLRCMQPRQASCLFAVVPDVVGSARATRERWDEYAAIPRRLGYRLAYVLQDGECVDEVPWSDLDAVFAGGTTAWKLSEQAYTLARRANRLGLWSHMGRVNSQRRLRAAYAAGYCSADGTYMAFNPVEGLDRIGGFLLAQRQQAALWR